MKKKLMLMVLGSLMAGQVMAAVPESEVRYEVNGNIGKKSMGDLKSLTYGTTLKSDINLNGSHKVLLSGEYNETKKDKVAGVEMKLSDYGVKGAYGYELGVNENMTVTPKVGMGYHLTEIKTTDKIKMQRAYIETGVEARVEFGAGWGVKPSATYEHDVFAESQFKEARLDKKRGNGFNVEVGVSKELESGKVIATPFYHQYNAKSLSDEKIKTSGVKIGYQF